MFSTGLSQIVRPTLPQLVDHKGEPIPVVGAGPLTIGRAPECDLVLPQPYVSRRHAEIRREGAQLVVTDKDSRHGTFVNGERVSERALKTADLIQFGSREAPPFRVTGGEHSTATDQDLLEQLKELSADKSDLERLSWMIEAARELNSAGGVDRVLHALLQATLDLAQMEHGYVFLANENNELEFVLGMDAKGQPLQDSETVSRTVIRQAEQGMDQFIVTDTLTAEGGYVPESIVAHSIRTVICIPLRQLHGSAGQTLSQGLLGVLYLDSRYNPQRFSAIDHELLRTIAREAAALVENAQLSLIEEEARLYQREIQTAAAIQQGLMPVRCSVFPFASVDADCQPCSAVGGDFFDVIPGEECVTVALVDVSGKGMPAAILAATLQGMLYTQLHSGQTLEAVASAANLYLCTKNIGKYATMILLRLHSNGDLEFMNCGHIHPRLCAGDRVEKLETSNVPVGWFPSAVYKAGSKKLEPGWRVVLVSDGYTEAENAQGEAFGEERLDHAAQCSDLENLVREMREFIAEHPPGDDCTVVQIAFGGINAPANA